MLLLIEVLFSVFISIYILRLTNVQTVDKDLLASNCSGDLTFPLEQLVYLWSKNKTKLVSFPYYLTDTVNIKKIVFLIFSPKLHNLFKHKFFLIGNKLLQLLF